MYAIVDANGAFDSAGWNKSIVHESHQTAEAAIRSARRQRQVQVIRCNIPKGGIVYEDAVGRTFERVWRKGGDR